MSCLMAAIQYDEDMYLHRCDKFNEVPVQIVNEYGIGCYDIYGPHSKGLEIRDKGTEDVPD
jgi:glutaredoxin